MNFVYFIYLVIILYLINVSKKSLHMLQQNLYNENNRYIKWVLENNKLITRNIDLFAIVFVVLALCTKSELLINVFLYQAY